MLNLYFSMTSTFVDKNITWIRWFTVIQFHMGVLDSKPHHHNHVCNRAVAMHTFYSEFDII